MHDCQLQAPRDPDTHIWRYMSFAKLVLLFETRTLFFPFTSQFDDVLEGRSAAAAEPCVAPVSSWHISDHESEAMWRLFSPLHEAIAIRSTYRRLQQVLPEGTPIYQVLYLDDIDPRCARENPLYPFFVKRTAFEHEKELRAVVGNQPTAASRITNGVTGHGVPVELETLLDRVLVSPTAPDWLTELVVHLGRRYLVKAAIEPSALSGTLRGG